MTLVVRCSRLPLFRECASSAEPNPIVWLGEHDAADLGTACHQAIALVVLGLEPNVEAIAIEHGVDKDDLAPLVAYGRKAWAEIKKHLPSPRVEEMVRSSVTGGTIDVIHADTETLVINDWKSGWVRRNHEHQLAGYAHAARETYGMPRSGAITTITAWLRFRELEVKTWTSEQLDAWAVEHARHAKKVGREWNPGPHCALCPSQVGCAARDAYITTSSAALVARPAEDLTPETLARLYPQSRMLKKAIEAYESAVKAYVSAHGSLPLDDGKELGMAEREREEIGAREAWPVLLAEGLDDDEIDAVLAVKKGALEDAIGAKAPNGQKGKRQAAVIQRLRESGAITTTSFQQLEVRKATT
jgi:hypothetical protein